MRPVTHMHAIAVKQVRPVPAMTRFARQPFSATTLPPHEDPPRTHFHPGYKYGQDCFEDPTGRKVHSEDRKICTQ